MIASRRRLRFRLSLLAMVALLWTQLAFATHSDCVAAINAAITVGSTATGAQGCEHELRSTSQSVCQGHCDQGEVSSDVGRVPTVPPLLGIAVFPDVDLTVPPASSLGASALAQSPAPSWRRPTAHPAKILLI